ncbi:MAG: metallophosphoesterase family protein [Candidatus Euphemobacter frigidus]|nr:metallophosphoesterase family protein [Candidatus Euphemobacter frigidus]MDP8276078.1 metallophosphoesterase family protein [Candidatus Euphemobacter frigidus]
MRYAILSDIHGNLEALRAVLDEARRRAVESYICLGDIVGYGANPNECLEMLLELSPATVLGNHDAAVCGREDLENFTPLAAQAIIWTRERIKLEGRAYLASLPLVRTIGNITIVHSNLSHPSDWRYIFSPGEALSSFDRLDRQACFFGHSHRPVVFRESEGWVDYVEEPIFHLVDGCRYLINVGSVGQPRDRDPRAAFAVFDQETGTVEIVRVEYPVGTAREKILDAGLPARLANRLLKGE